MSENKYINRDGQNAAKIFDNRSVEADYPTLIPLLQPGLSVLDVGCGTGAISQGIAKYVGPTGRVVGIDHTEHFIQSGSETYADVPNLELQVADVFTFAPAEKFDLIVSARVLQWLSNPQEALLKMKNMLKPNGQISILDYNHEALEWRPEPPASMRIFYNTFLKWRADAGMNNRIAEDLSGYFKVVGLQAIEVYNSDEVYTRGEANFKTKAGIWAQVAKSTQMVEEGYLQEADRLKAIAEYTDWVETEAMQMTMKLKEVRGKVETT